MTTVQAVLFSMLGFACGCLVNAGFVLQMLYAVGVRGRGRLREAAFFVAHSVTGLACGFSTVLVVFLVVMKDGWHWGAFAIFAFWTAFSLVGSILAFHRVAKRINPLLEQLPRP